MRVYRIKDQSTGLYYTGGTHGWIKNPDYNSEFCITSEYRKFRDLLYDEKVEMNFWSGKYPWNKLYKETWNSVGKIFTNKSGADKALTTLCKVPTKTRQDKTKNILFGTSKSISWEVVECIITDVNPLPKGETND